MTVRFRIWSLVFDAAWLLRFGWLADRAIDGMSAEVRRSSEAFARWQERDRGRAC
jgi:hypothetical protein